MCKPLSPAPFMTKLLLVLFFPVRLFLVIAVGVTLCVGIGLGFTHTVIWKDFVEESIDYLKGVDR